MATRFTNFKSHSGENIDLLVENGLIVANAEPSETIDGGGEILVPGLIDSHCHILPTGLDLIRPSLVNADTREQALQVIRDAVQEHTGGWMQVVQYDQNRYPDAKHLTRWELDEISSEIPILLRHSNGHAGVANTAALQAANISPDQKDPEGGNFVRDESGELTGVLLERANEIVSNRAPHPSFEEMVTGIMRAGDAMASVGLTRAADMLTGRWNLEQELLAYTEAANRGCKVRLSLYMIWSAVFGSNAIAKERLDEILSAMSSAECEVAGIKIFADGAIGSATAAVREPFTVGGLGTLIYEPDRLIKMVRKADEHGYSICIHSIGDRSTDVVMDALEQTANPNNHRIEHVMILDDQQIERIARLNLFTTMQPEFLTRFGHGYKKMLGPERAAKLNRARSVLDAGIRLSLNSDRPIVQGNPLDGMWAAVNRPEGYDQTENISWEEALQAYTESAAQILKVPPVTHTPGDHADMTILNAWPVKSGSKPSATYKSGAPTHQETVK